MNSNQLKDERDINMNNEIYMDFIEERLYVLKHRIILRSELNILNLNLRAEDFYRELFNAIYGYNLINANVLEQNASSIDLIDNKNKVIIQVTCTVSKTKIEKTLSKAILKEKYADYTLYFIFIGHGAKKLKGKKYTNPYQVSFDSKNNIFDIDYILKKINSLNIDNMTLVYDVVVKYLKLENVTQVRLNSLLPKVIKSILCTYVNEDLPEKINDVKAFEISEKIKYNNLEECCDVIDRWAPYEHSMAKIYNEFDSNGKLKSLSLLMKFNRKYKELKNEDNDPDEIFFEIIRSLKEEMINNMELWQSEITEEELETCIEIIVVDAFIRCKIFEKPGGAK